MSSCHHVLMSLCHHVFMSSGHHVLTSSHPHILMSSCHHAIMSSFRFTSLFVWCNTKLGDSWVTLPFRKEWSRQAHHRSFCLLRISNNSYLVTLNYRVSHNTVSTFVFLNFSASLGLEILSWTFINSPFRVDFRNIQFFIIWWNMEWDSVKILQWDYSKT